jgi:cellulose biosynthesis protein BcsS
VLGRNNRRIRAVRKWTATIATICVATLPFAAVADDTASPASSLAFLFGGVDAGPHSIFTWAGIVSAPSSGIGQDGIRVRAQGGGGQYQYETSAVPSGKNRGTVSGGELMIGNRFSFDAMVITAYIGIDARNYSLQNPDPNNPENGSHFGIKASGEMFTRTAPDWFVTAYGNISSVFASYNLRVALNRELVPGFALGPEAALLGDSRHNEQRGGLIATMSFLRGSITVAGGLAHSSDNGNGGYTTVTIYAPF